MDIEDPVTAPPALSRDTDGIDTRSVVLYGAILAVGVLVVSAALWGLVRVLASQAAAGDPVPGPLAIRDEGRRPPGPRLQERPFQDIQDLRREDALTLGDYSSDLETGAIRIPIERAMELIADRGLPSWGTPPPTPAVPTPRPAALPKRVP